MTSELPRSPLMVIALMFLQLEEVMRWERSKPVRLSNTARENKIRRATEGKKKEDMSHFNTFSFETLSKPDANSPSEGGLS